MPDNVNGSKNHARRRIWAIILTCALVVASIAIAFPPQDKINQGLDIQGGLSVVLKANPTNGQSVTDDDMQKAKSIIEQRVNALGASEASVQVQNGDQILVQIPGMSDSSTALDTIGKTGKLEFARLDTFTDETVKNNIDSGNIIDYEAAADDEPKGEAPTGAVTDKGSLEDTNDLPHIKVDEGTYTVMTTGDHITDVSVGQESEGSSYYAVNLVMDDEGTKAWADATSDLAATNGKIVILLDGEVNSAPATQAVITNGRIAITGNYTLDEARSLQTVLDSGSLPVSFTYEQSQTVGPTLGQGELQAGLMAMLAGLALVIVYLLVFYRGFGIIAAGNMAIFSIIYMGVLGTLSYLGVFSLSLAGIAGIILSIGTAADSAVLTIERFKEELKEGKTLKVASKGGVKHAIVTSLDADVVSIISALSLFALASSSVKGFGLTLSLGIACDMLVMLIFIGPSVRLLAPRVMRRHPGFWGLKYSIQLGDERSGVTNYLTPSEAKAEDRALKDEKKKKKEKDKRSREIDKRRSKNAKIRDKEHKALEKKERKQVKKNAKLEAKKRDEAKITGRNGNTNSANTNDNSRSSKQDANEYAERQNRTSNATVATNDDDRRFDEEENNRDNINASGKLIIESDSKEFSDDEASAEVKKFLSSHSTERLAMTMESSLPKEKSDPAMITSGPSDDVDDEYESGKSSRKRGKRKKEKRNKNSGNDGNGNDVMRDNNGVIMNRAQRRAYEREERRRATRSTGNASNGKRK